MLLFFQLQRTFFLLLCRYRILLKRPLALKLQLQPHLALYQGPNNAGGVFLLRTDCSLALSFNTFFSFDFLFYHGKNQMQGRILNRDHFIHTKNKIKDISICNAVCNLCGSLCGPHEFLFEVSPSKGQLSQTLTIFSYFRSPLSTRHNRRKPAATKTARARF